MRYWELSRAELKSLLAEVQNGRRLSLEEARLLIDGGYLTVHLVNGYQLTFKARQIIASRGPVYVSDRQ